ncbi:uncharacterized protein GGS22DRAFT_196390 [Annulohypoxylon maeteangense]|uniref:uncharacterized protein n=1 Tax=Annulohypoxylon maeteangense TaxID=1927788 RepID=UPI0020073AB5|nr:uncharacterized protein GGS22DRAFT_196390 [Annulohypoxylon maeteangense]KAI0881417.1 hypothetical protein GGS22DRAFT_196390 [Annulohypoxylon maeteangense]
MPSSGSMDHQQITESQPSLALGLAPSTSSVAFRNNGHKTTTDLSTDPTQPIQPTEDVLSGNTGSSITTGTKRAAPDNTLDSADSGVKRVKRVKRFATWKEAFQPIVDSVPSEDAPIPVVRRWFRQIGGLHGIARRELLELRRMCLLGHNLRQADYSDLKDYLVSISQGDGSLRMHASILAASAYEAVCLKKAMEAEGLKTNITKGTQTSLY